MNIIERIYYNQPGGMFREFEGLMAHFEPKDPSLYRNLLPEQFFMPRQPVVSIFLVDYLRVISLPITNFRYQEWSVLLKCLWNGEEGWCSTTMYVSSWLTVPGGRHLGFPKYTANNITLTKNGENRIGMSINKGIEQLRLEYSPEITRSLAPWETELLENVSFFKGDTYLLVPPSRGPKVQKVIFHHVIPPKWSPVSGMIQVKGNPNELWTGLIPDEDTITGAYNHFVGGANLLPESGIKDFNYD